MGFRAICIALLFASLPIAGCGTVENLVEMGGPEVGGKTPFGGVKQDLGGIKTAANGECAAGPHPESQSKQHPQVALLLAYALDLPFSLLGDVVTLPYTAYTSGYAFINQPVPVPPLTPPSAAVRPQIDPPQTLPQPRELPSSSLPVLPKPSEVPSDRPQALPKPSELP